MQPKVFPLFTDKIGITVTLFLTLNLRGIMLQAINNNICFVVIGFGMNQKTAISDMQIFKKSVPIATAGDNVGINIKNCPVHTLKKGMMLVKANSFESTNHFEGTTYFLSKVS